MTDKIQRQLNKFLFQDYVLLNPELLQKVIAKGANLNIHSSRYCGSPLGHLIGRLYRGDNEENSYYLHDANVDNVLESCKVLIDAGAKLDRCKTNEAFQSHVLENSTKVNSLITFLDEQGVDFVNFSHLDDSPLEFARTHAILKFLLDKGADPSGNSQIIEVLEEKPSRSILGRVMYNSENVAQMKEMMEMMIEAGANVNAVNSYGVTVLHDAVSGCNPEMINFFLDKGIDPSLEDDDGANALDILMNKIKDFDKDSRKYKELIAIKDRLFRMMDIEEINIFSI